ncbi:hypothetical protein CHS0354_025916 [Potamilus streckersoni]|uniref:Tyrosine 3-monooxygenase n=1 Tax=Potamilus streckersoni TaxID=2493646 RepID=A0AAE0T495_9BIVA|nr:hypothetical protein CHS0354_025916 [Potamilus streckersoni]
MLSPLATDPDTAKRRLAFQKSYSQEHGGSWRRKSLIEDAKFETLANIEFEKQERKSRGGSISEEEEVFQNGEVIVSPVEKEIRSQCSVMVTLKEGMTSLSRIIRVFESSKVTLEHIESRRSKKKGAQIDLFLICLSPKETLTMVLNSLRQSSLVADLNVLNQKDLKREIWIPTHIADLDKCTHLVTKFEPELDSDHPGFTDMNYRARRAQIADIAFEYKYGQKIPRVEYTEDEIRTWGHVYRHLKELFPAYACKEHNDIFKLLEKECGYSENTIPQLEDVSNFLKRKTGWQLRPVAGLLLARDFLASLAFRTFQCTQYIRHGSKPDHSPEPDCIHELIGHVPMLADPIFAQFSQELGLASLGASDEDIERFATLYWFTVEFGLCKQNGDIKAYGAGTLSSYGELQHAMSENPEKKTFDPSVTAVQQYTDQDLQPVYFVTESFENMMEKMRVYAASIVRPYNVRYNPYTQSIETLDDKEVIRSAANNLQKELEVLHKVILRLNTA